MKFLKRTILVILMLTAIGLLFRGWLYRHLITYKSLGQRANYTITDTRLSDYIDSNVGQIPPADIEQIIERSLSITSKQLNFTAGKNEIDPNRLMNSKTAHCIGYASFFATSCNHLLKKYKLADGWTARPQIGRLYFLGTNVHPYFKSAFFKDHDFVTIENKMTGEVFAVDPTVHDYLSVDFVRYSK